MTRQLPRTQNVHTALESGSSASGVFSSQSATASSTSSAAVTAASAPVSSSS